MVKRVVLATKLDSSAAANLRKTLIEAREDDVVIDASGVEMIGALCLETLMSAVSLWRSAGLNLMVEDVSDAMQDDLGRFGLTSELLMERAA